MKSVREHEAGLPEETYIQLVRDLFDTLLPTVIMTVSFTLVAGLAVANQPDALLVVVSTLGTAAVLGRIGVLWHYRHDARDPALSVARARRMERQFRSVYLCFAVCFGVFAAAAYWDSGPEVQGVVVTMVFGYGAGATIGLSVRPRISIPGIVIATVPIIVATACQSTPSSLVFAFLLSIFLTGGVLEMIDRYRLMSTRITAVGTSAALARHDDLTGLGNRLALREAFDAYASASARGGVAVLCLDLDRFKPVNDVFGHAVGDALLVVVAARLRNVLRDGDFAARLGGDEFVVIQTGVRYPTEVEMLARRIVRDIAEPYRIDGHEISIGTSIGYVLSKGYGNLDDLATRADGALYRAKRQGGGIAAHNPVVPDPRTLAPLAAASQR